MPRQKVADRVESLRQKRAQIEAQLQAAEARQKEEQRKADTRRKVIAGALALEHMEKNKDSEFSRVLGRLLDEYVTRPGDRRLFPYLPEIEAPKGEAMAAAAAEIVGEGTTKNAG